MDFDRRPPRRREELGSLVSLAENILGGLLLAPAVRVLMISVCAADRDPWSSRLITGF